MFMCLAVAPRHLDGRSDPIGGGRLPVQPSVHGKLLSVTNLTPLIEGGYGPIGLQFDCEAPFFCRTDTGQCCSIYLSEVGLVCPNSC